MLLTHADCHLVLIDIQEKLLPAMAGSAGVLANAVKLATAARHFGVPITISEQYPKGIGHTVPELLEAAGPQAAVFEKLEFSCARNAALRERAAAISRAGRRQMILCGIEAHVCVLQTVLDCICEGYQVHVVVDALGSRYPLDAEIAIRRMECSGAYLTTTESTMFEWCRQAGTAEFKTLSAWLKEPPPS